MLAFRWLLYSLLLSIKSAYKRHTMHRCHFIKLKIFCWTFVVHSFESLLVCASARKTDDKRRENNRNLSLSLVIHLGKHWFSCETCSTASRPIIVSGLSFHLLCNGLCHCGTWAIIFYCQASDSDQDRHSNRLDRRVSSGTCHADSGDLADVWNFWIKCFRLGYWHENGIIFRMWKREL